MKKTNILGKLFGNSTATCTDASSTNEKSTTIKKKARIHNLIIVDESGSMSHLKEETISGINETINTIREAQKSFESTQLHMLTLVTFDTRVNDENVRTVIDNKPISKVKDFEKYNPSGCTPLYDAMGQSLTALHNRIKDDKDATAVVTILTDGMENSSTEWRADALQRLIEKLKEEGWTFAYMGSAHNVKEVSDLLSIDNVVEFKHDERGVKSLWKRQKASQQSYYRFMNDMYSNSESMTDEDALEMKRNYAKRFYGHRVTPHMINEMEENEIFVFGSNANGWHDGGAAAQAMKRFGAIRGQGEGLQGHSYAIPTMEGLSAMSEAVERFTEFAAQHPQLRFLVTRIGCGIAGYQVGDVAPLFRDCIELENVALPADFWHELGLTMYY